MKILITGAPGFVASYLVDYCLEQGDEVIGTIRWNEDLSRLNKNIKIEHVELTDLSSLIRCINKHRPDVISHLAAQSWVPYSFDNPIYTIQANTIGTLNLLEAVRVIQDIDLKNRITRMLPNEAGQITGDPYCLTCMKRFPLPGSKPLNPCRCEERSNYNPLIHICSSSEFYGKVERKDLPITESHSANPGNPYGVGKVGADFLSQIYAKYYDMRIVITRMFTHTGIGRTMMSAENYYAKTIAELEKEYYPIAPNAEHPSCVIRVSDLEGMESIRTWADVKDAVKNYYNLFKSEKTGIYNISGETTKSIQEVLDYLISISKLDANKLIFIQDPKLFRKINVDKQVVDITKFKEDVTWSNDVTFEELMQNLLNYWRENEKKQLETGKNQTVRE